MKYKRLKYLIGTEIEVMPKLTLLDVEPITIKVIDEYPAFILVDIILDHNNHYHKAINKSKLFCGQIYMRHKDDRQLISREEVITYDA